jgi:hypothetical protein
VGLSCRHPHRRIAKALKFRIDHFRRVLQSVSLILIVLNQHRLGDDVPVGLGEPAAIMHTRRPLRRNKRKRLLESLYFADLLLGVSLTSGTLGEVEGSTVATGNPKIQREFSPILMASGCADAAIRATKASRIALLAHLS